MNKRIKKKENKIETPERIRNNRTVRTLTFQLGNWTKEEMEKEKKKKVNEKFDNKNRTAHVFLLHLMRL